MAESFGVSASGAKTAGEVFMQRYYRNAKRVTQLNTVLVQNIGAALAQDETALEPVNLDGRFQSVGDCSTSARLTFSSVNPGRCSSASCSCNNALSSRG
jgi:UTP:GlnB (protein PII) uridylyltransferase